MSARPVRATGFTGARIRNILIAVLVPIALVLVYFAGVGGSTARGQSLPVLLVNNDIMVEQANADGTTTQVVAGRLLVTWLTDPENAGDYDWELVNGETATQRLNAGTAYAAVEIPEDFSAAVVSLSGGEPRSARIHVIVAQGSDFSTGAVMEQVFAGMAAQFGQQLTNQVGIGLVDGLNESAEGLQDAADGAQDLADGAGQLGVGVDQYVDGAAQLADGSEQLADGASQLASGLNEYGSGVGQYVDGANSYVAGVNQYTAGANQFAAGVEQYTGGVSQYTDGVAQYVDGVQQLADGLAQLDAASPQLQEAAAQLGEVAEQLSSSGASIGQAMQALTAIRDQLAQLGSADPSQLFVYCDGLDAVDPEQAAACRASVQTLIDQLGSAGIDFDSAVTQLDELIAQVGQIEGAGEQLAQLADGLNQYTGGVSQSAAGAGELSQAGDELLRGGNELASGSDQLNSAASQMQSGSSQLTDGGGQLQSAGGKLASGAEELTNGAGELADGVTQLHDGQQELADSGEPLSEGVQQLKDGASTMSAGLQDGADQTKNAIGDPEKFADTLAQPVVSDIIPVQEVTFAGMLASLLLPIGVWLAGVMTVLRRGLVTDEALDSSASNWSILLNATRRLGQPVLIVALGIALLQHLAFGVPWGGIGITLLFAPLATLVTVMVHLLLAASAQRRTAVIESLALLVLQLLLVRGFVPLELRAGWVASLSGFAPLQQLQAGMQAGYAGATVGSVVGPVLMLIVMIVAAGGAATVVIGQRRRRRAAATLRVVAAAELPEIPGNSMRS